MCKKRYAFFHAMPCEDECGSGTQDDMLRTVPPPGYSFQMEYRRFLARILDTN